MPKPGAAEPLQLATPVGDAAQRPDADPQRAPRPADRRRQPGAADRQRCQPARQAGAGQLHRRDARRGHVTRNALQIADEVAQLGASLGISSSMDATTLSARSLSKNFAATLTCSRTSRCVRRSPPRRSSGSAPAVSRSSCSSVTTPNQVAAQVTASALYGPKHPYGYSEIGTEAALKASRAPTWRRSGSRTSCPTTPRWSSPATSR